MREPERLITARTTKGELLTLTYGGWATRNSCKKKGIQQRMSIRNIQIKDNHPSPYTMERVVGTEKYDRKVVNQYTARSQKESLRSKQKKMIEGLFNGFVYPKSGLQIRQESW